ncbi:MAG TPA: dUTP diphosphatase [Papillibacter sp.]|jgi:dUTP pyrophosphatase|nr:dUTP diphosphatase [Papillibacter sp.]
MEKPIIRVRKLKSHAALPEYGSAGAAGADLRACIEEERAIGPGETVMIPTGLALEIPPGYVGLVCARSGLSTKRGLAPANKVGVIDSDYRGEVFVPLHNHSGEEQAIAAGERIAQLLIVPVLACAFVESANLDETQRSEGGFGSTGRL